MTSEIKSKENANVKHAVKLLSSAKFRKENRQFIIEGVRLCADAVSSCVKIEKVFYTEKCYEKFQKDVDKILNVAGQSFVVTDNIINLISDTDSPQGVVCVCSFIDKKIQMNKIKECKSVVILENIQNPSNLGAIFRTCNAFGIEFVAITPGCCDVYNPKVLRSSMGSVFRLSIEVVDDMPGFINFLNENNFKTYATSVGAGAVPIKKIKFENKSAVVFGNEGNGVTAEASNACKEKITIPMNENAESLNVSIAAGIIIWEMAK